MKTLDLSQLNKDVFIYKPNYQENITLLVKLLFSYYVNFRSSRVHPWAVKNQLCVWVVEWSLPDSLQCLCFVFVTTPTWLRSSWWSLVSFLNLLKYFCWVFMEFTSWLIHAALRIWSVLVEVSPVLVIIWGFRLYFLKTKN